MFGLITEHGLFVIFKEISFFVMIKIGFDKRDPDMRKFYYDDNSVLTSNPPKYKIWYVDDITDIDYVDVSQIFVFKSVPPDDEIYGQLGVSPDFITQPQTIIETPKLVNEVKQIPQPEPNFEEVKPVQKKRGRPRKNKPSETEQKNPIQTTNITTTDTNTSIRLSAPKTNGKVIYEVVDDLDLDDVEEFNEKLNELGKAGWDMCGFETYRTGIIQPEIKCICIFKKFDI